MMKEIIILLLTVVLLTACQSEIEKRKILHAIEQRLEIDTKEYNIEYTLYVHYNEDLVRQRKEVGITLTHKTHMPMEKEEERRYGDKYIPMTGDICGKCKHILYNADSSKIVNVMGM